MTNPLLSPTRVRAALRSLELRPTRGMGQNFLIDPLPLAQIIAAAQLTPTDLVVEVGPGLGVLTWELLQRCARVVAVELDRRLADRLPETLHGLGTLQIIQGDVLNLSPALLLRAEATTSYKLVANLPYAITGAVLRHFLEATPRPTMIVVLVQWEVAERIVAKPGALSMLAHSVQVYAAPEIVARVGAQSFLPAPAVDSAILRLQIRPQPLLEDAEIPPVFQIMKAGFLQARKQLGNALPTGLAALGYRVERTAILEALERAGVAAMRRAETVTLAEWYRIYQALGPSEKR